MSFRSILRPLHPKPKATAMKRRNRLIPILALLAGAAIVQHADAASSLVVNTTFTVSKDVSIVWGGTGGVSGTAPVSWPIGLATLGASFSTVTNALSKTNGAGWPLADGTTLVITNQTLTGDAVVLTVTPTSAGWAAGASAGANQFVAACTANNTPPADTAAVFTAGTLVAGSNAFATVAETASTLSIWFAFTVPSSFTGGVGAGKTVTFTFLGTAF